MNFLEARGLDTPVLAAEALEQVNTARMALGMQELNEWPDTLGMGGDPVGWCLGGQIGGEHLAVELYDEKDAERVAFVWAAEPRHRAASPYRISATDGKPMRDAWIIELPPVVAVFAEQVAREGVSL